MFGIIVVMSAPTPEQQFLEAYELYAEPLYRHCFYRVYNEARAEELMQETFLKTWEYVSQGKEVGNLRAFLYRVAGNLIIDYYRKKKEESLEAILEAHPEAEPGHDPTTHLETTVMVSYIKEVLEDLPDDARIILTYRYIDDLDPKEIAEIMDITANNASVRINRALRLLQQRLDK